MRQGGRYTDQVVRSLPFWRAAYSSHQDCLVIYVRSVQKGTKLIQVSL